MIISSTPSARSSDTKMGGRQLELTHPLTTEDIREPTEESLTDEVTNRGGDLDTKVLVGAELSALAIDIAQHHGGDVDGENVVPGGSQ